MAHETERTGGEPAADNSQVAATPESRREVGRRNLNRQIAQRQRFPHPGTADPSAMQLKTCAVNDLVTIAFAGAAQQRDIATAAMTKTKIITDYQRTYPKPLY